MERRKEMCSLKSNEPGAGIVLMKLEELHSFEGHPFKVERNQELFELRCSIEKEGVLVPLMLRKNPYGDGYETRIAKANNMSEEKVRAIIEKCTDSRFLGALGEKTVNVLKVNLMLDGIL